MKAIHKIKFIHNRILNMITIFFTVNKHAMEQRMVIATSFIFNRRRVTTKDSVGIIYTAGWSSYLLANDFTFRKTGMIVK